MTNGQAIASRSITHATLANPRYDGKGGTDWRYRLGGDTPPAFDCSGYLLYLHGLFGIKIPSIGGGARTAALERGLRQHGRVISVQQAISTPGALLFRDGHAEVSMGNLLLDSMGARNYSANLLVAAAYFCRAEVGLLVPGVVYDVRTHVPVTLGASGEAVRHVQTALRAAKYTGPDNRLIVVDGSFGPYGDHAVRRYQQDNRLHVDGQAGPVTQTHMGIRYRAA